MKLQRTDNIEFLIKSPETTIKDVAHVIQGNHHKVVFICIERRLVGTVTDGDLRRALEMSRSSSEPVKSIMNTSPTKIHLGKDNDFAAQTLLERDQIRYLPVIDEADMLHSLIYVGEEIATSDACYQAVIMAGGLGTRLRPLTNSTPKPMLEINGMPVLEHIILHLSQQGFKKFKISVNFLSHIIMDYFKDGKHWDVEIEYLCEKEFLGTAGSLKLIRHCDEPFLMINADIITKASFSNHYRHFVNDNTLASIGARQHVYTLPYGCLENDGHRVTKIIEKPSHYFNINSGVYLLKPEVLDYIQYRNYLDMPTLLMQLIEQQKSVTYFTVSGTWYDIGNLQDLENAKNAMEKEIVA